jgi:hypothetical protein
MTSTGSYGQLLVEVDWHPFETGLNGLYIGGMLITAASGSLMYATPPGNDVGWDRLLNFGLGAAVGYDLVLPLNLLLNVAAGFGADYYIGERTTSVILANSIPRSGFEFRLTRLEASLGYRF